MIACESFVLRSELVEFHGQLIRRLLELQQARLHCNQPVTRPRFVLQLAGQHIPDRSILGSNPRVTGTFVHAQFLHRRATLQEIEDLVLCALASSHRDLRHVGYIAGLGQGLTDAAKTQE